jgi:uncharacterized membrane protein SpoIIM required for sporulation
MSTNEPPEFLRQDVPSPESSLQLKSQKFREQRQGEWRALSTAISKAQSKGLRGFSPEELLNLPLLYRSAVSSLSMARSISLDRNLITYLEALSGRAYVFIYGPHSRLKDILRSFFIETWPGAVRSLRLEILLCLGLFVIGMIAGWVICARDASFFSVLVPGELAGNRNPEASADTLKSTLGGGQKDASLSVFAAWLMSHNIRVCLTAFAFGVLFGLPTFLIILMNSATLGAMLWLFFTKGLGPDFSAWLSIHGTTEIMAIVIAGGCGFHLARRLVFPGRLSRLAALGEAGKKTGSVMLGVWLMLMIAGLLEGYGRQLITESLWRFMIGLIMLALWIAYFTLVRPLGQEGEARAVKNG